MQSGTVGNYPRSKGWANFTNTGKENLVNHLVQPVWDKVIWNFYMQKHRKIETTKCNIVQIDKLYSDTLITLITITGDLYAYM